jgi:polar amino acid transport system substrate-binding protein
MKAIAIHIVVSLILLLPIGTVQAKERPNSIVFATHDQDWYPIDYKNEEGDFVGIFDDLIFELFEKRLGLDIEVRRQPWNRSQAEVENGLADILITVPTAERTSYAKPVSTPFFNIEFRLLVRNNHSKLREIAAIDSVDDIHGLYLTLVSTYGNGWYEANVKAAGIKTEYVKTDEQQIRFLLAQRADALIDFPLTIEPLLSELDPSHELVFTDAVFARESLHIMVGKKSPWFDYIGEINAALISMQDDPRFSASQRIESLKPLF